MIDFRGVTRVYWSPVGRSVRAVDDLSLQVADGEVLGIAGPNGAGKSTLLALLLGFQNPTSGDVRIDGEVPRGYVERNGIGYVPELMTMPLRWRCAGALRRLAILAGIPAIETTAAVDDAIARLGLGEHRTKRLKALSKGNLQRVGVAQATLRRVRVYVFDEPTHGLDPTWTVRFRELVASLRGPDVSIVIASHNLDELQRVADRVAILDGGRLQRVVATGYGDEQAGARAYRVLLASGADELGIVFPGARAVGRGEFEIRPVDLTALNIGLAELLRRGALVAQVAPAESVLEQQFRAAVGDGDAGGAT